MSNAQFIEHVGISIAQISHRKLAQQQCFEHRLLNEASRFLMVGSDWLKTSRSNLGLDQLLINRVEVDRSAIRPSLYAKRHKNEQSCMVLSPSPIAFLLNYI